MKKIILLLLILMFLTSCNDNSNDFYDYKDTNETSNVEETIIVINLYGEIKRPGLYYIKKDTILYDLIYLQAGGFTKNANVENINLGIKLENDQIINIPSYVDKSEPIKEEDNKININQANISELTKLTGIGETIASRIIEYRDTNGYFKKIEEIKNVKGISDGIYNKIKDYITI